MRHIIAAVATLLAAWAIIYMVNLDKEVNKLDNVAKLIQSTAMEDSKIKVQTHTGATTTTPIQTDTTSEPPKKDEVEEKLKALKEKAGNIAAFETSALYKKNCASCHGNIGEGIIGTKLIGRDKAYILKALHDFKSGKRKNYVMYGLLGNLDEDQLEQLAEEISTFKEKLEKANSTN